MAYGRNFGGSYANGGDAALASQIMQFTRENAQRKWETEQQERMRRQQVKDANAQAFDEAGRRPRENSPAFLATDDGRTGYVDGADFIPSQADALAARNRQLMDDYRMQGVQTRAAQKERENLQNVALCGMIQSAQQNGGFVDPSMLDMVNQQLGDGSVKCIGGDTDGRGNLRIYGETGNGVRGVMMTLNRQQQAALMGKTPGIEGGQAFVEKYLTDQIANGVSYEDAMKQLGLDPGKMKSGASRAMRGESGGSASGGKATAQEKFDKEWFGHLTEQIDDIKEDIKKETDKAKKNDLESRLGRYQNMLKNYEDNFAARYPTADEQTAEVKRQANEQAERLKAQQNELKLIREARMQRGFNAAFQNGQLVGSAYSNNPGGEVRQRPAVLGTESREGSKALEKGERVVDTPATGESLRFNGQRYEVGDVVDFGNGVMATWLGGGSRPENFELVVEQEEPAPKPEGAEDKSTAKSGASPAPIVTKETIAAETPKGEGVVEEQTKTPAPKAPLLSEMGRPADKSETRQQIERFGRLFYDELKRQHPSVAITDSMIMPIIENVVRAL